ncbi:MAG TPA: hypothetical protein VGM50_14360 [Gemmatimonadaceae bacterium]
MIAIPVFLGFADLPLNFSLDLFRLAFELLARVTRQAADGIPHPAFDLFPETTRLVVQAIALALVRHASPCAA